MASLKVLNERGSTGGLNASERGLPPPVTKSGADAPAATKAIDGKSSGNEVEKGALPEAPATNSPATKSPASGSTTTEAPPPAAPAPGNLPPASPPPASTAPPADTNAKPADDSKP